MGSNHQTKDHSTLKPLEGMGSAKIAWQQQHSNWHINLDGVAFDVQDPGMSDQTLFVSD
jgi:hypothetical protein